MGDSEGVVDLSIRKTPLAILDFETTGLNPGADRIVEVTVMRREPGRKGKIVFDTIINPERPLVATQVHGITEDDVAAAPAFKEIAGNFVDSIAGCVVASYNVYFAIKFLEYELSRVGFKRVPPYLCLMNLRPMLGLGIRCPLQDACRQHNIEVSAAHTTSADVLAAELLFDIYLDEMKKRNISTFGDFKKLKRHKFVDSFTLSPLDRGAGDDLRRTDKRNARAKRVVPPVIVETSPPEKRASGMELHLYWDALKSVLADLNITDEELRYIEERRRVLDLSDEQVRVLHARAFLSVLTRYSDDKWLDDKERDTLRRLYACLSKLGWAPGE